MAALLGAFNLVGSEQTVTEQERGAFRIPLLLTSSHPRPQALFHNSRMTFSNAACLLELQLVIEIGAALATAGLGFDLPIFVKIIT